MFDTKTTGMARGGGIGGAHFSGSRRSAAWDFGVWAIAFAAAASLAAEPPFVGGLARQTEIPPEITGAVLMSELSCAACHMTAQPAFAPKTGPDLSTVGARLNGAHLREFIESPSSVKPGTTMPDVLAHLSEDERKNAANTLAHYLASLGKPTTAAPPSSEAVERGGKLYHTVGCVACHSPEESLPDSVPLGPMEEKYTLASLAAFLKDPLATRPGGRMPDCQLEPLEAREIASYLLRGQMAPPEIFEPDATLAARGKEVFAEHRCHACHSTGDRTELPTLPALSQLRSDQGCLSETPGAWPRYPLSHDQRSSLRGALAAESKSWTPTERVHLTLTRLNCLACHERDGVGGASTDRGDYFTGDDETLGEQGRLPPRLTGVGAKLKAASLRDVLVNGAGARPYLHTRMPKYGASQTEPLVAWLKELDTLPSLAYERVPTAEKPHEVGRALAGAKGFNCVACHTFRGRSAAPIRALDLMTMTERLEEHWFHHFLAQPQRFVPLTVMPGFWPDGKSPLPNILDGDPGRQRDALWQYLARGPEAPEPPGLVLEPLVVKVEKEAVIVRRAYPGIGKRGLGVGYPGGINLAFDAEWMRLGSIWSGGFIEASALWRGQGSGQARLLGKEIVNFPPGPAFAILATPDAAWPLPDHGMGRSPFSFLGYSLDETKRPSLRYEVHGIVIEDFFRERRDAAGNLYLERTLHFPADPPEGLHFRAAAANSIEPLGPNEFAIDKTLRVRLPAKPILRDTSGARELLLPVSGEMKLEYRPVAKP